jgi:hypothetical protein
MRVVTPADLLVAFAEARAFARRRAADRPRRTLCAMLALHPVSFLPIGRLESPACSS